MEISESVLYFIKKKKKTTLHTYELTKLMPYSPPSAYRPDIKKIHSINMLRPMHFSAFTVIRIAKDILISE